MGHNNEDQAYGFPKAETVVFTSASLATQIIRIPWPAPYGNKARLKKIQFSSSDVSGAQLLIWDADLSNSTQGTRGTGTLTGCMLNLGTAAAVNSGATTSTTVWDNLPCLEFEAGVAAVCNRLNAQVSVELEIF
jgi:hypothetical protein